MATNIIPTAANIETTLNDCVEEVKLLHNTADEVDLEIVQVLMNSGININAKDENGNTVLHNKARDAHGNLVNALIAAGVDIESKNVYGKTPLHVCAENGHKDIAKILFEAGADINAKDETGRTPLHCCSQFNHVDVVKYLASVGVNVNAKDKDGNTALHYSAKNDNLDIVNILIAAGADVDAINNNIWTPLHCSADMGHSQVVKAIIAGGADVNNVEKNGETPLFLSARSGLVQVGQIFTSKDIDIDLLRNPVTAPSTKSRYLEIVNSLLASGADVNAKQSLYLVTALHECAKTDNVGILKALIAGGADIYAQDSTGHTPLHIAIINDEIESCKVLMKYMILANCAPRGITYNLNKLLRPYWDACLKQFIEMMQTKLGDSSVSLFTFLKETDENKLALYSSEDNFGIRDELRRAQYKDEFSVYAEDIEDQFAKGSERAGLLEKSANLMTVCFSKELPFEVSRSISEYLSNGDLMNFLSSPKCKENPEVPPCKKVKL